MKNNYSLKTRFGFFLMCFVMCASTNMKAQLTGTKNIPGDYASLILAIDSLNLYGVGAGGVTLNLIAGTPQTAPAGGYAITASGTLSNQIIIEGNGNTITAGLQTLGKNNDAIFKIIGGDYITLQHFIMQENSNNISTTAGAFNTMTEWGVALLYASASNGAQNNTIQNNSISLNKVYRNSFGIYSNTRHTATAPSTNADAAAGGSNTGNKVYGNKISNVNVGICFTAASAVHDSLNDIGGGSTNTGNKISNWGGNSSPQSSAFNGISATLFGIYMNHQDAYNVSFDTIISAAGINATTFAGIRSDYSSASPSGIFTNTISNNTITLNSASTSSNSLICINSLNGGGAAASGVRNNIMSNTFLNCAVTGASSAQTLQGIVNSFACGTLNVSSNIFSGTASSATTGGFTAISNSAAVVDSININNNQIGNAGGDAFTFSAASSGAVTGITNSGGDPAAALSIKTNNFKGFVHTIAGSSVHAYIVNTASTLSQNISSNTFTNLNVNTTGSLRFISNDVALPAGGFLTANSNSIVTAFTKGAGGTVFLYYTTTAPSSLAGTIKSEQNNNFSNITLSGSAVMSGWSDLEGATGGGAVKTISGNTFSNWILGSGAANVIQTNYSGDGTTVSNNTISNISGSGAIQAINIGGNNGGTESVSLNRINTLAGTGAAAVNGIASAGGTTSSAQKIFKNKIYDLQAANGSGTVNGILISAGPLNSVYNNLIGDLRATVTSSVNDGVRGISITSAVSNSIINVYNNSVYLNAVSSGTNFSTSGIFQTASTTAGTASLDLRNNLVVNLSTPSGTGLAVAFCRSAGIAGSLANLAATSNNNLFYAGTPAINHLIYSDGVSMAQTLASYQAGAFTAGTIAPRETASVTENPAFLSTTGTNAAFLHIDNTIATLIESGAVNIASVSDDIDGDIRQGSIGYIGTGSAPDIGADEFNGIDIKAPVISYTALIGSSCLTNRTFSASITDGTGVNTITGTAPRVWFKKKTNLNVLPSTNTNTSDGWKYTEASNTSSPYNFTIDYSLIFGGAAAGDSIQYFITAQDIVSTPNVGINSGTFAAAPSSSALTAAAFPIGGAVNSYLLIGGGISGTVTIGAAGTYTSITGAANSLFAAINAGGLAGNTSAEISDASVAETGAAALNTITYGCSSFYTLTIKPAAGVTAVLTGSSDSALIKLKGADYVTIDGSNSGGTSKDLTITNTSALTSSAVIWIGSASAADGASNNTIKNCIITGNADTTTAAGIISSSGHILGGNAEAANSNNTYQNNAVSTCQNGIAVFGPAAGESITTISGNSVGSATAANKIGFTGIYINNQTNAVVADNTIFGVNTSSTSTVSGIITAGAISGGSISGNKISDIKNTNSGGYGSNGIFLTASSLASNLTVYNNMIYDVASYGFTGGSSSMDNGYGIIVENGGGYNIYYNTIAMNTDQTSDGLPAAFNVTNAVTAIGGLNVRNNIFSNTQTIGVERYSIICSALSTVFSAIDFNDYDAGTAPDLGNLGGPAVNLAAWQLLTNKDVHSISSAPVFTSASDLHLVIGSNCGIDHRGTPITGITADIDADVRNVSNPDIGADEFLNPGPVLNTTLSPPSICSGASFSYTPGSAASGATFAWTRAAITGITEAASAGSGNVNETLINTSASSINVTYVYTTTAGVCSNLENVVVAVNPSPALTSSLTPPAVCSGTVFNYTPICAATGASITWTRAVVTGISNTAGTGSANPNEVLINTTASPVNVIYVYSVSANGCTNTPGDNVTITVNPAAAASFSAFSSPVCILAPAFLLTGGSPAGGYYSGTGADSATSMFSPSVAGAGTFSISYTLITGSCSSIASQSIAVEVCTGEAGNLFSQDITVYPNPTSGQFDLTVKNAASKELLISIVDIQGKEVYNLLDKNTGIDYSRQINLKNFAKGIYYLKLRSDSDLKIQKLIIQ